MKYNNETIYWVLQYFYMEGIILNEIIECKNLTRCNVTCSKRFALFLLPFKTVAVLFVI
jgi:hypothetical protein